MSQDFSEAAGVLTQRKLEKVRITARMVTWTAGFKVPCLYGFLMIVSCDPNKLVVLCHVIYVKLTGCEGKIHGQHAGKQQRGRTVSWVYQAPSGLTTSRCRDVVAACLWAVLIFWGLCDLAMQNCLWLDEV